MNKLKRCGRKTKKGSKCKRVGKCPIHTTYRKQKGGVIVRHYPEIADCDTEYDLLSGEKFSSLPSERFVPRNTVGNTDCHDLKFLIELVNRAFDKKYRKKIGEPEHHRVMPIYPLTTKVITLQNIRKIISMAIKANLKIKPDVLYWYNNKKFQDTGKFLPDKR